MLSWFMRPETYQKGASLMDAVPYSPALDGVLSRHRPDGNAANQTLQPLDALSAQSRNLAKWHSVVVDDRIVPSYVLIGPRTGRVPIRLALLGGTRASDFLSTISIVKLLVELDLAPLIAQDFALFGYPLANPSRTSQPEPEFDTSFWKGSNDPVVHFFEQEFTADKLDGMIAVRANEPLAGFQIQVSSRVIATEVLWRALELPQKLLPLANEPVQVVPHTEIAKHSFANLSHLCPKPFSLIIRTPRNAQSENQISAIAFSIKQILLHYRSLVRQADSM
jgi:hypothetical protein